MNSLLRLVGLLGLTDCALFEHLMRYSNASVLSMTSFPGAPATVQVQPATLRPVPRMKLMPPSAPRQAGWPPLRPSRIVLIAGFGRLVFVTSAWGILNPPFASFFSSC